MNLDDYAITDKNIGLLMELLDRDAESSNDHNRVHACCFVGTETEIVTSISFTRGKIEEFRSQYESLRQMCLTNNQPSWKQVEIGPIEEKYFFFFDDSSALNPPILRVHEKGPTANNSIDDDWNALSFLQTHGQPKSEEWHTSRLQLEILELWKKRRISYGETLSRIASMVIAPKPANQKYSWHDALSR